MRCTILVALFLAVCLLTSCGYNNTYENGYADGYNDGYSDAELNAQYTLDEAFSNGFDTGYDEGYDEVRDAIDKAADYAREQTGWSVYEAYCNISIYNDGVHPNGYALPTEEEYLESIDTLVYFCEHLENAGYGG